MECQAVTRLSEVTLRHLRGVVGRTFRARRPDGRLVELKLLAVTDMRRRRRLPPDQVASVEDQGDSLVATSALGVGEEEIALGERPFGLLFEGPRDRPLLDDIYDLELRWLPLRGLHLSPLSDGSNSSRGPLLYEAILD